MSEPDRAPVEYAPHAGLHDALGAKLMPFAGHAMPVRYSLGILAEHLQTRADAGHFGVSHMGQTALSGGGAPAVALVARVTPRRARRAAALRAVPIPQGVTPLAPASSA